MKTLMTHVNSAGGTAHPGGENTGHRQRDDAAGRTSNRLANPGLLASTVLDQLRGQPTRMDQLRDQPTQMDRLRGSETPVAANVGLHGFRAPVTIELTAGDDNATIRQNADGNLVVSNPGSVDRIIYPSISSSITVRGLAGNDTITIDESVTVDIRVEGGAGDDYLYGGSGNDMLVGGDGMDLIRGRAGNDTILGGDGADNVEGGAGNDQLFGSEGADYLSGGTGRDYIHGGAGRDSLYGGAGADSIFGGTGNDYLDGGLGDDGLDGGAGTDSMSGGKGNDRLRGGSGADTLIGASGADRYLDANSVDTIVTDSTGGVAGANGATVRVVEIDHSLIPEGIVAVNGREEFRSRVADDMETYRSLASGQAMLRGLADITARTGNRTSISELDGRQPTQVIGGVTLPTENGFARAGSVDWVTPYGAATPAPGADSEIFYNPSVNIAVSEATGKEHVPPAVVLFHELSHAYNHNGGTGIQGTYEVPGGVDAGRGVGNVERQAIGLPIGVDHDADPRTSQVERPSLTGQPTENDLRRELGIGDRVSVS